MFVVEYCGLTCSRKYVQFSEEYTSTQEAFKEIEAWCQVGFSAVHYW